MRKNNFETIVWSGGSNLLSKTVGTRSHHSFGRCVQVLGFPTLSLCHALDDSHLDDSPMFVAKPTVFHWLVILLITEL